MPQPNSKNLKADRLTITLGSGQRRKLQAIARQHRTSLATVIRWALDKYIASNAGNNKAGSTSKPR